MATKKNLRNSFVETSTKQQISKSWFLTGCDSGRKKDWLSAYLQARQSATVTTITP